MKRFASWAAVLLVVTIANADGRRTPHEYVPDLRADEGTLLVSSGGAQPEAIIYRGEVLPAPEGGARNEGEAVMRAPAGDGRGTEESGRRSPSFRPDRITSLNDTVPYYEVFTPGITPFKRVTAYDAVVLASDGTPVLVIGDSTRRRVEAAGAMADSGGRTRDPFWGSVVLDFSNGRTVPFPAVAPNARILTMRTEPATALRIEQDGADNMYATPIGEPVANEVRVVFLTDAPRDYFGAPLPRGVRADALAARVHPLPAPVQRDADLFAAELGLTRASDFAHALATLVRHFRSFEESDTPPNDSGNIYLDLARGMRGICRHRVYAFVITAHALGMHARFVQNEAHAWAEVELPGGDWLRIDLGGAATGLEPRGHEERPMYDPGVPDPLPRPEEYERAYERARRMSAGFGSAASASAAGEPSGAQSAGGTSGAGERSGDSAVAFSSAGSHVGPASLAPSRARRPLELVLDRRSFEVFRGRELEVSGIARSDEGGVSGLRIEVLLRTAAGTSELLLGVTVSREGGVFHGAFGVPPDLAVGDYRLIVRSPGNADHAPAQAM